MFLHHRPPRPGAPITADFAVEVTRDFEPAGEVVLRETPACKAAAAVHAGGYDRLREAHDDIEARA